MLRTECDAMKQREKQYMEQCQRDSDVKIQVNITGENDRLVMS